MKILIVFLSMLLFFLSCRPKYKQGKETKSFFDKCDELNFLYYAKDSFIFKTIDTSTIQDFTELISGDNDNQLPDSDQKPEQQLIYKSKGKTFFTAYVFNYSDQKGILGAYVSYTLREKKCKHLLTYRTGMGIDEIYHHKINPTGNPWTDIDTTNFHYEDIKNTR